MKTVRLVTLTLLSLMNILFPACAKDDNGHTLTKLWAAYEKAVDADKPKDQADILEQIKKQASSLHLAWDYYDACWKYVSARSSSNWKLRDELREQASKDIDAFGEPVAVFYNHLNDWEIPQLLKYAQDHKEQLLSAHNPEFYERDGNVCGFSYGTALVPRLANDYEYVLWSLFGKNKYTTSVQEAIREHFEGRYPFDAFIEYTLLQQEGRDKVREQMPKLAERYAGKAFPLLVRDYLLMLRDNDLRWDKGTSEQYRDLARDCQTLVDDCKRYSGDDKDVADCCDEGSEILSRLTAQEASVEASLGKLTLVVRNLPSLRVRILDGKKEVFDRTVQNPVNSFYLRDTLHLDLPVLDDKTYTLKCTGGKVDTESDYDHYTLSIAHKRDRDGYGVYVADFITGEPVKTCDITLYDDEDKPVEKVEGLVIDGFTYLPDSFAAQLSKKGWGWHIQAVTRIDGRLRCSRNHNIAFEKGEAPSTDNPKIHHAFILTDRSAFTPDETVHYKVLTYEGTYEFATRAAGIRLTATLTDPSGKEIGQEELTTNEFGTAAGAFVLKKGEKGGMYKISVRSGNSTIATAQVRADEFVLPTFDLTWTPSDRFYLPGDLIEVAGNIRSYSGHNLGTATATYQVTEYGSLVTEGPVELAPSGDFKIRFPDKSSREYGHSLVVTVRVTDATGETLEFSETVQVSRDIPLNISLMNEVKGSFTPVDDSNSGAILGEGIAHVRFQLGRGSRLTHPGLKIEYTVLHEGNALYSGTAPNGEVIDFDLSRYPSGAYTVEAKATVTGDAQKEYVEGKALDIIKASDTDTALGLNVRCFFKEIEDDGRSIALQVGTTTGPAWVVAELYGEGNRLLDKRIVTFSGGLAKDGSLKIIRFERKNDYPEDLTLKVFWFHDGRAYQYAVSSFKPKARFQLPLSFSRFLDTTSPHHDYSFTILTGEGVEVAATIFDKSTETIQRNVWRSVTPDRRSLPSVSYKSTFGVDQSFAHDRNAVSTRTRGRMLSKAAGGAVETAMMASRQVDEEMVLMEDAAPAAMANDMAIETEEAAPEVAVRENFANTIAWEPFLRSDKDGVVTFNFTTADKLSTYYVQLFAHDKAFNNATLRKEMVVTLPVKVAVVQPQYLYEGDRYVCRVTVSNSKGQPVSGRIGVKFLNGKDYKTAPTVSEKGMHLSVPAYGSADFSCEISAPKLSDLGMLVSFTADNADFGSDAVFVAMPVSPAVQEITEAHSSVLLAGQDRDALLTYLRGLFVNVPGSEAAMREISILDMIREAVPEKVLPESENLLDQSESLYANFLIDRLPGSAGSCATPEQRADMVKKILACHNKDGGFGWFPEMHSSLVLTAVLLERLAEMGEACPEELRKTLPDAVHFLDQAYLDDDGMPFWCGYISPDQYLHVRALYPEVSFSPKHISWKVMREFKKDTKGYLVPGRVRGLNGQVFAKARRMKTLRALLTGEKGASLAHSWGISLFAKARLSKSLDQDIESLLQYAEPHRSGGTYYPNAVMPWRGLLESELYAHSLICNLLTDCGHNEVAEGIRLWIMVQKETQQWEDDPAYIQAIHSVLNGTEETLQTKVLALSAKTILPFEQIKATGNGFTLQRTYTRDGKPLQDGDILHVGDKVTATYAIWNEENRSFVRLTAPRPAAFRPVDQLSGRYGWFGRPISITGWVAFSPQGYRSVLADRTEFWFDSYPEEKTSFTEEFFVTQEGTFQCPVPVIESLYAPHYRANDDGHPAITVQP